ncbi:YraN family protein [Loktanella sp. SALINAS62]|uniref:YraN family protein n=1 Tax=Loktanella sp. SALINAS62 TaxID=2706124 RepID=UPI001B8D356F|nr:YraN family protein [Loktanella sp. SALINAS62]MBS1301318.1 hypothetical protein [Loktanella sp. SALINAS62]
MTAIQTPAIGTAKAKPRTARQHRGQRNYHAGVVAEDIVAQHYLRQGCPTVARRWRGTAGEIDLIVRDAATLVFVEVKKSSTFDRAATHITRRQADRICTAATAFVASEPTGQLTPMRFDVALVDGIGAVRIIPNAFGGW